MRRIFTIIMIAAAVLFTSNNMSAYNSNSSENYVEQEEVDDSEEDDGGNDSSSKKECKPGYGICNEMKFDPDPDAILPVYCSYTGRKDDKCRQAVVIFLNMVARESDSRNHIWRTPTMPWNLNK